MIVLFIGIALLLEIGDRAPLHLDRRNPNPPIASDFYRHYGSVLDGSIGGPYAYRLLVPWMTETVHWVLPSFSEIDIDAGLKTLILFLLQATFFWSLRRWFSSWVAFAGVLWMDVLVGYSLAYVLGPASGETTDLLNLLVFIIALDFMLDGGMARILTLFVIGMFNRETPLLLLPLVYVVDRAEGRNAVRTVCLLVGSVAVYLGLRIAVPAVGGGWFTVEGLAMNIPGYATGMEERAIASIVHVLILLGPLFMLALPGFTRKPLIFRGSIVVAAALVLIHFAVATVIESRLWMPLYALLIPSSLHTLNNKFARNSSS